MAINLPQEESIRATAACNGNNALCSRKYSNITHVGAHDSAFVGVLLPDNQNVSPTEVLNLGVRFLQAQTHSRDGTIEMCHTSCLELDAGSLAAYLAPIKAWLDSNPDEVVTLLLTNQDAISVSDFATVFAAVGLDRYAFSPASKLALDEWPTLQSMISTRTRLVTFMDYHADTSKVPYILDEFAYFFETPYDTTDSSFPECTLDRPAGASPDGRMYIVNHFLDIDIFGILIPDRLSAPRTNSVSSILAQSDLCYRAWGRVPNFILLDWIDQGQPMAAQNDLNGL
ncbi:PLC-like phosphodiesterase [Podospora appendiculata]|uniref:PLC-like phosphodiesterase n=1 Tax=Podospora appendiculata TaxID=314037 RepID=A0AAE0X0G7_9PEZI|nr:PLC-like phosphodiesterase [Podospora appendiculata]